MDEHFEHNDSGASPVYPMQAGSIKKGGHVLLKGKPCKIVDVSTSKTGKHGHAKAHFVGIDIFTGKKVEDMCPTSHNMEVPNISRIEYTLLDITNDGYISVMNDDGNSRDDLSLPNDETISFDLKKYFEKENEIMVTVIGAMGLEIVTSFRVVN